MNKEYLDEFINQIEKLSEVSGSNDYVEDSAGRYLKRSFLEAAVSDAKELIRYREYEIALENLLENLNEVSIALDENTADLAHKAFGERITPEKEQILSMLTKNH